jgi:hypothetical protein
MILPRKKPSPPILASLFLRGDIQKEGDRILLPYLTTKSRLRLSECCRETRPYRDYLSRVRIVKKREQSPAASRAFAQWILQWKPGYLQHLEVRGSSIFILGLAMHGAFEGLESLRVMQVEKIHAYGFLQSLSAKTFVNLEELYMDSDFEGGTEEEDSTMFDVCTALSDGACPKLQRLRIDIDLVCDPIFTPMDPSSALADAILSGNLSNLTELTIDCGYGYGDNCHSKYVLEALSEGTCPKLVKLNLQGYINDEPGGRAFDETFRSGAFDNLEVLDFFGTCCIFEGIKTRKYHNLKELSVVCPFTIQEFNQHLGRALVSGCFPKLQKFDIQEVCPNAVLRKLQEGLRRSKLPQVRELIISYCKCFEEELPDLQLVDDFKQEFPYISMY